MTAPSPSRVLPRKLWTRARALRAFSFPLSALPVAVATAAVRPLAEWDWGLLLASVLGVVSLHATGNLLNDYFDFRSGVDRRLEDDEARPGRFLVKGDLKPRDVLLEAAACAVLGLPVGAFLVWRCGPNTLWFAGAAVLGLYAYTGPPFNLKYRALGEAVIFVVFGPLLMAGAAYTQVGRCPALVLLLSVPVGLVTTGVLLGNNMRDADEDEAAGIRTLGLMLGTTGTRIVYVLSLLVPPIVVAALVATGMAPAGALACFVSLVPACLLIRRTLKVERVPDLDARTARFALIFMTALGAGMVL